MCQRKRSYKETNTRSAKSDKTNIWSLTLLLHTHGSSSTIASEQSEEDESTSKVANRCLDYIVTFPNGTIT